MLEAGLGKSTLRDHLGVEVAPRGGRFSNEPMRLDLHKNTAHIANWYFSR